VPAVQPPVSNGEGTTSPGLVELAADESWEAQDLPEAFYATGVPHFKSGARYLTGTEIQERILRQLSVNGGDKLKLSYYGGFVAGFFDNPYSSGKDLIVSIAGIAPTAAHVAFLHSPLGMMWEFTFGDAYVGEVKAAFRAAAKAEEIGRQVGDAMRVWGPPVCEFLEKLALQTGVEVEKVLLGEIPHKEKMGPELQLAIEVLSQLLMMADDGWTEMTAYERGYWQGYIAFEVFIVVVGAVLSAPEGGVGGAAVLARHAPKLKSIYKFLEGILEKLQDIPALGGMLAKVRRFISELSGSCFVAGTPVLTSRGRIPIEQVREGDHVWSRAEDDSGNWRWRRVLNTKVTQSGRLYHVAVRSLNQNPSALFKDWHGWAAGSALCVALMSAPTSQESIGCTAEHPFWVETREALPLRAFVPASDLRPGDMLRLSDGGAALITEVTMQEAQAGGTFTTYNLEVADTHTYCVGASGIWVHNWCTARKERFMADALSIAESKGWTTGGWLGPKGQRLDHIADMVRVQELLNVRDKLGNVTLGQIVHEALLAELKDYTGPGDLGNIWSYTKLREIFKDFIPSRDKKGMPSFGGGWEVHHLLEKHLAQKLGLYGKRDLNGNLFDPDASPSIPLRAYADADGSYEKAFKSQFGPNAEVPYHQQKGVGIKHLLAKLNGTPQQIVTELSNIYKRPPFDQLNLWPATRDYLQHWLPELNIPQ